MRPALAELPSPLDPAALPLAEAEDGALAVLPIDIEPQPCADTGPCIRNLRVIQFDYSALGGTLVCSWSIFDGPFEEIVVYFDGVPQKRFPGDTEGVNLGFRRIGTHEIRVQGIRKDSSSVAGTAFTVLSRPPISPVEITRWISYGFQPLELGGSIELQWRVVDEGLEPIIELEIFVDGKFQGTAPVGRGGVTFSKLEPGPYRVQIRSLSRQYTSGAMAETICVARPVPAPDAARCEMVCEDGRALFRLLYRRPVIEDYDFVAVWIADESAMVDPIDPDAPEILLTWRFRGFFKPQAQGNRVESIAIRSLPAPDALVELAGAKLLEGIGEPVLLSNIPRGDGEHVRVSCLTDPGVCENRALPFRRGDANLDGTVDIGDAVRSLFTLFVGGFETTCPDAIDSDDNGRLEITDPIYILNFLFLGTNGPPPDPGPLRCGVDPTPDALAPCVRSGCPELLPADNR